MPALFSYLLKLSVSLAMVFLFYQFVLRRLTFYNINRLFILGFTILSFIIPLIDINPVLKQNQWSEIKIVQWVPVITNAELNSVHETASVSINYWFIGALMILAGILFTFCRLLIQFISFRRMKMNAKFISGNEMKIYQVNESIIPFSFGRSIFINRDQHTAEELQEIIRHEFVHVKQGHSFDIIWGEILYMLNWYNPFAWVLKKSIRQNLEFIADDKVLRNGVSKKDYQYLLLKVVGNNQYSIATQFNFYSLKKRITMMNKIKSTRFHLIKFLFILPLVAVMLVSFRQHFPKKKSANSVFLNIHLDTLPVRSKEDIPENVKSIHIDDDNNAVVKLRNGKTEEYDLNIDTEKAEFEKKYGELPPPPPPPQAAPALPRPLTLPENVSSIDINNKLAIVKLKNGNKEKYDLSNPKEKTEFEKKYGEILPPPPPPAKMRTTVSLSKINDKNVSTITSTSSPDIITNVNGKLYTTISANVTIASPAIIRTTNSANTIYSKVATVATGSTISNIYSSDVTVVSPSWKLYETGSNNVIVSNPTLFHGEVDIEITISNNNKPEELEEIVKKMKEKGYELRFTNKNYNDGVLSELSGTIKYKDDLANFNVSEFNKLTIISFRDGDKVIFKIFTGPKKVVI